MRRLVGPRHLRRLLAAHQRRQPLQVILRVQHRTRHSMLVAPIPRILVRILHQIQHLRIKVGKQWRLIEHNVPDTLHPGPLEKVLPLGEQQKVGGTVVEHVASACHLPIFRVLADLHKVELLLLEVVAQSHKVKVAGHKDQTVGHAGAATLGQDGAHKVVEACVER
jgi:hypothetical protein